MNIKELLIDFVLFFVLFLVTHPIATYLYSLIVHGAGAFDLTKSFLLAVIAGIVFVWIRARERKKKRK